MKPLEFVLTNDKEVLSFLKTRFPVFHMSNIFFRDIQYGIREMFERRKQVRVGYEEAEVIAREFTAKLEKEKVFKKIDGQTWLVDYPEYKTVSVKKPVPAKPAVPKPAAGTPAQARPAGGLPPLKSGTPAGGLPPLKSAKPAGGLPPLKSAKPAGGLPPLKSSPAAGAASPKPSSAKPASAEVPKQQTPAKKEEPKEAKPLSASEGGKIAPLSSTGKRPALPPIKSSRPAGG